MGKSGQAQAIRKFGVSGHRLVGRGSDEHANRGRSLLSPATGYRVRLANQVVTGCHRRVQRGVLSDRGHRDDLSHDPHLLLIGSERLDDQCWDRLYPRAGPRVLARPGPQRLDGQEKVRHVHLTDDAELAAERLGEPVAPSPLSPRSRGEDAVVVIHPGSGLDPPLTRLGDLGISKYAQVHIPARDDEATEPIGEQARKLGLCMVWRGPGLLANPAWARRGALALFNGE